jgi:hypothetical protein
MSKLRIGVIIYTKIGTNTSILMDEFRFFNNFHAANPDCEFVFIAISEFTKKSILNNRSELNFPMSIIKVESREDLPKLNGLSGLFSYMTRNNFFGGKIDGACIKNYMINAYCTRDLGIPLFIRTPDSEYHYKDYKRMIDVRIESAIPSVPRFIEENQHRFDMIPDYVDYSKVYFVANGSDVICDWVKDVAHYDLPENLRMLSPEEISERTIYVSDADLFNVWSHYRKYSYLETNAEYDKLVFIGYLSGSVAKNRLKILPKIFKENLHEIPTDIIGPGASDILIDRSDVDLKDKGIYGDSFFEELNKYLAYIFIGKGNKINKYINKTVYDCISARCPVIVFSECDQTGIIFNNREYYFSNESELNEILNKLRDPEIRNQWINDQYIEITDKLNTLMHPMLKFHDYCNPVEIEMKTELSLNPLF